MVGRPILTAALTLALGNAAFAQDIKFNSTWWNHALGDEQQGFIYGYQDCRQPQHAAVGSINDYQDYVTRDLQLNHRPNSESVMLAIRVAEQRMPPRKVLKGGETWKGPHGFLDGGWWGPPNRGWDLDQRGFVEGFVVCATGHANPVAVSWYVGKLNKHYAKTSAERDPIAVVFKPLISQAARQRPR